MLSKSKMHIFLILSWAIEGTFSAESTLFHSNKTLCSIVSVSLDTDPSFSRVLLVSLPSVSSILVCFLLCMWINSLNSVKYTNTSCLSYNKRTDKDGKREREVPGQRVLVGELDLGGSNFIIGRYSTRVL